MAEKITIKAEKETLLITLMARALESRKENPIVSDPFALEMIEQIDYDFSSLNVPVQTVVTVCLRSAQFDRYCLDWLREKPLPA